MKHSWSLDCERWFVWLFGGVSGRKGLDGFLRGKLYPIMKGGSFGFLVES